MFKSKKIKQILLLQTIIILKLVDESTEHGDLSDQPGYRLPKYPILDLSVFAPPPDTVPGKPLCNFEEVSRDQLGASKMCTKECFALTDKAEKIFEIFGPKLSEEPKKPPKIYEEYAKKISRWCRGFKRGECQNFGSGRFPRLTTSVCECQAHDYDVYSAYCRNYMIYARTAINIGIGFNNLMDGIRNKK